MAITRAQQFRQMLEDGGMLVKPGNGKRPGYRGDAASKAAEARGDKTSRPGPGPGEKDRRDPGERDTPGFDTNRNAFVRDDPSGPPGTKILEKPRTVKEVKQDLRRAVNQGAFRKKGFFDAVFPTATKFLDSVSRSKLARINNALQRQNYIDSLDLNDPKEKEEYDRIMNELGGLGIDIIAGPETLTDTRLKQPMSLGAPKTKFKPTMSFGDGVSSLGDPDVKDILGKGFQDYLKRFDPPDRDDRGPSDPCLGPNPPSYCFIGKKADETVAAQNAIARNLGGLSPRIAGSIFDFTGMAEGGIVDMAREEMFLGGIVKGIKKGLKSATRAFKKVAKSPIGKAALLGAGLGFAGIGPFKGLAGTKLGTGLSSLFKGKTSSILNFVKDNPMLAIGGASLLAGAMTPKEEDEFDVEAYYAANRLNPNPDLFPRILGTQFAADGGRIGYAEAGGVISEKEMKKIAKSPLYKGFKKMYEIDPSMAKENPAYDEKFKTFEELFKKGFQDGGRIGFQEGGIMSRLNQLSGSVSSAEQMLQSINQRLQSAESSLGGGGDQRAPGFGIRPNLNVTIDPNFKPVQPLQSVDNMGFNFRQEGDMGRYVADNDPGQQFAGYSSYQDYLNAGNDPVPRRQGPQQLLSVQGRMGSLARSMIGNGFYDLNVGLGQQPLGASGIPALGLADGGDVEPVAKKTMPLLDMGGQEMDLRDNGGFVPIGRMEKADDVPARLSKNEFVFTAEAVRNAGDGDVDKGAEVMYNMMKNLEDGGNVSEESQGLEGARRMFQTSKRLEEVL